MEFFPFQLRAPIVQQFMGTKGNGNDLFYQVILLPEALEPELPFDQYPRLRVDAELNGVPTEGTFMPADGRHYLMVSKRLQKLIGAGLGDEVDVRFGVAGQDAVHVPSALAEALDDLPDLKDIWDAWTPSKRRGWAHRVATAKQPATIAKRVEEVLATLADG